LAASPEDKVALVDFNDNYYLDISPENAAAFWKVHDTEFQQGLRFFGGTRTVPMQVVASAVLSGERAPGSRQHRRHFRRRWTMRAR